MSDRDIIDLMFREVTITFWDFRCNFMHSTGSIPFDLDFFRLVKNSDLVFNDEAEQKNLPGLISFKDKTLNSFLEADSPDKAALRDVILKFFYLRKEFMKIKRTGVLNRKIGYYISKVMEAGYSYGYLQCFEGIKRQVIYTQSDNIRIRVGGPPYTGGLGDTFDTPLKVARNFRPGKKRGKDNLGKLMSEIVHSYYRINKKYPSLDTVIGYLGDHQDVILNWQDVVDGRTERVQWKGSEKGTTIHDIQKRLTEIRKEVTRKYGPSKS